MHEYEYKTMLKAEDLDSVQKACKAAADDFLHPAQKPANVVGMGVGVKWKNGQPTGEPALLVMVTHKLAKDVLSPADLVPSELSEMQTDVVAIGYPIAGCGGALEVGPQTLDRHLRPVKGGFSIGHRNTTAGTVATCVYDLNKDNKDGSLPSRYYLLSNNHVLANNNNASIGDPILQPGPYDGGVNPRDCVAFLSRFIPITFEPPILRERHQNFVDAAIAEGQFHNLDREIYWIGYVKGWEAKNKIKVGMRVQKTGRSTNYTTARILAINATVDVNYSAGRVARFKDQIITTSFSAGGDSGSLVTTMDNAAVGLLFAGSSSSTIINQIENVRSLLQIEIPGS